MRHLLVTIILLIQLLGNQRLLAQKECGSLKNAKAYEQTIDISVYHKYDFRMVKGAIALLNVTDFDVRLEMTVVRPDGIIAEQVNTAETADFLIFEAPIIGEYKLYIKTIDGEENIGKYSLTPHFIASNKKGKKAQIRTLLEILEKPQRAGVAVAIVKNNQVLFEHHCGYSNVEHQLENNTETVFELASVSKQFTAFAIAKLAEEGKLSVEDDIRTYFPELPDYGTRIQVKHLLNHTSGIIDSEYPLALAGFESDPIGLDRVLNFLKSTSELYFEPGSEFSYSNDGYTLLGELVHRVTGQDFKAWMAQNVFGPLEMNSTVIRDSPEIVIPNRATSYMSYTGDTDFRRKSFDFYAPGGCSVRSSLSNLTEWVNYLNQGYRSQEKLFRRINQVETFPQGDLMEYAYGNFVTDFRGLKRYSHLGLSAGFTTAVARFPEQDLGFIFLANDGEFRNYYLSRKIYEIFLEEHLEPKSKVFSGIVTATPSIETSAEVHLAFRKLDLKAYEGSYFSQQINASYSFQVIDDTLYAISAAYSPIPIISGTKDTLMTDEDFMETLIFRRDYNGNVSACEIINESGGRGISFTKIPGIVKWSKPEYWRSSHYQQRVKDTLEEIDAADILTGFVVSVIDESETFFQEAYGHANVENDVAYTPETIQLIASISKSITGIAVMKAMELGYFDLDDAINEYLPYKIINPNFPDEDITIRHLLTHTSSLNDTDNYNHGYVFRKSLEKSNWPEPHHESLRLYNNNDKLRLSEFLDQIIAPNGKWYDKAGMYTDHRPGTIFEYSNMGFALLGYIIELTTKDDFKDFTQHHIFDPLDMKSSTWELEDVDSIHHATYYLENYNVCPNYSCNTIPDGGLYTNVIDLTKFLQEAIRGYAGRGTILSQSSYREMFRSQSDLIEIEGGLGWDLSIPCCIGHAGNDFGVSTVMYFEPRTGIGRIIFSNTSMETDEIENTFYGIMNLLFLREYKN